MEKPSPETLAKVVNLANDLRASFGAERIEEIPKAIPRAMGECILARAFNFDCWINPVPPSFEEAQRQPHGWQEGTAHFNEPAHAKRFVELAGGRRVGAHRVALTPELTAVALAFDHGLLPEYEAEVNDAAA